MCLKKCWNLRNWWIQKWVNTRIQVYIEKYSIRDCNMNNVVQFCLDYDEYHETRVTCKFRTQTIFMLQHRLCFKYTFFTINLLGKRRTTQCMLFMRLVMIFYIDGDFLLKRNRCVFVTVRWPQIFVSKLNRPNLTHRCFQPYKIVKLKHKGHAKSVWLMKVFRKFVRDFMR